MRIVVHGRAAHSSTPWLGDNAVLKAVDVFRAIESLPFTRESSEMFDRPSINLGRIEGGDALNKVPDRCTMAVDVRYLPGQDPGEILAQVRAIPGIDVKRTFIHPPVTVSRAATRTCAALRDAVARAIRGEVVSVGRDGASDAASFIEAGIPAVEFGPAGAGHHGPEEWVSLSSLARYRRALADFVRALPTAGWRSRRQPARSRGGQPDDGLRARVGGPSGRQRERLIPRSRGGTAWRFVLAAVVVIGATAATTAVAGLLQVKQLAATSRPDAGSLKTRSRSQPRAAADDPADRLRPPRGRAVPDANTDTMMLVRLDAPPRRST